MKCTHTIAWLGYLWSDAFYPTDFFNRILRHAEAALFSFYLEQHIGNSKRDFD